MLQLSDGYYTNKNGGIPWYKEVAECVMFVKGCNSTDEGTVRVTSVLQI